ncbi:hypothetical protein Micbo1qcDRAFT_174005 [Microdochium bolleyi]|uniref:Uncharacterized protein n=1 Tax=Microdochium bolleyi TaxID=196109 RepID=A0A136J6W9_9PEZI|nr:hypothetical protein Micbo1qcDRAFT_174005 [Microdochium bolleyi]
MSVPDTTAAVAGPGTLCSGPWPPADLHPLSAIGGPALHTDRDPKSRLFLQTYEEEEEEEEEEVQGSGQPSDGVPPLSASHLGTLRGRRDAAAPDVVVDQGAKLQCRQCLVSSTGIAAYTLRHTAQGDWLSRQRGDPTTMSGHAIPCQHQS